MSVEKIAPLPQTSIEVLAARASSPAASRQYSAPFAALPAPTPEPGASAHGNFFESLALPLPSAGAPPGPQITTPVASYAREAVGMEIPALVDGRLPQPALTRAIARLLRDEANARETTLPRVIDNIDVKQDARLPSRNGPDAEYSLRGSLLAQDEGDEPRLLDLYLTRVGARQWEAAVYRNDATATAQRFPLAGAPINVERLIIDPSNGHILACVAQQIVPQKLARGNESHAPELIAAARRLMLAIAVVATTFVLARIVSRLVAIGFFVTAVALAIRIPVAPGRGDDALRRSRRRRS